ncbi:MAG: SLBB domain-containing protein [Fibromonadaceae bacterium]|nr:SLBB domain-containing protein [Fibromonadaceae bacterium]
MVRLIYLFAFLIAVVQIYAQSLSPAQAQMLQAQMLQAQTNPMARASASDIAAAREILNARNFQGSNFNNFNNLNAIPDTLSNINFAEPKRDTNITFNDSSLFDEKKFMRYENIIFSQSLPSAFFEVQGIIPADYPLKQGDYLELSLWGAVEKQFTLYVNNQGNVFVEGAGLINVANLSLGEAEKLITKKLQNVYSGIVQGRISVNLRTTKLSPTKVFVMGSVKRPGGYDLPGNANVFLALYKAGGPDEYGSVRNIIIRRANGDSAKVDLYNFLLRGQKIGEGILRDGDLVFIQKAEKLVKATGTIGRPAIYELKNGETLSDLLAFAGGLLPNTEHTVNLWRINKETGAPEVFDPGTAKDFANRKKVFQMQDGDSIFVFASTKHNTNAIQVTGSVFYPGYYVWEEGMLIKDAIALAGGLSSEAFKDRAIVERINADSSFSYFSDDFDGNRNLKLLPGDNVVVLDSRRLKNWRMVSVTGFVKDPHDFEWQENLDALDLVALCGGFLPNAMKNEITIERLIEGKQKTEIINLPIKNELSAKNNKSLTLMPGDRIVVKMDTSYYEHEVVALTGAFKNPGFYSLVKRGETFKSFINRLAIIDEAAFIKGGQLFRRVPKASDITSTASTSSMLFNAKIDTTALPKTSDTTITSYRINFDFERVLKGKDKDIELQANDSIYIPFEMLTVNVIGEVISPGHILWQKGWNAYDYLNAAGGLTITGDDDRIVLTYANGSKTKINKAKEKPNPGSTIQVFYKPIPEPTKWTEIVTAIGTLATAFAVVATLYLK